MRIVFITDLHGATWKYEKLYRTLLARAHPNARKRALIERRPEAPPEPVEGLVEGGNSLLAEADLSSNRASYIILIRYYSGMGTLAKVHQQILDG